MKLNVMTLALAATVLGVSAAHAQTTVIQQGPPAVVVERPAIVAAPPAVVVEPPATSTTVEHNNLGILGNSTHTKTTTIGTGVDCTRQTVQTNTLLGSSTSSNTTCQ